MLIDFNKVNVYQADKLILQDVNFQADEGEFIYIIGKVGSGKSSLLKTMYCELDIDEEDATKAEVLGRDLTNLKRKEIPALRKEMGIIFQDFQLLHDSSVLNNLRFVLKSTGWKKKADIQSQIEKVLEKVGMSDKINCMPHELSGGEQQRVAIARALLNEPKIIIADEPTGNLDPETATNIVQLLKDITQTGTSVVMSTHNIPMLDKFPGKVYQCKNGCITDITKERNKIEVE
jgi:cell division transport system ATP-binding protein